MTEFGINVKEILQRTVIVEVENPEEAVDRCDIIIVIGRLGRLITGKT